MCSEVMAPMKLHLNKKEMIAWRESVGGPVEAALLISEKLECSESKGKKIAGCRYPSGLCPMEQIALADLMKRPREAVFPMPAKAKRRHAA